MSAPVARLTGDVRHNPASPTPTGWSGCGIEPRVLTPRRLAPVLVHHDRDNPNQERIHLDQRAVGELERTFCGELVGPDDMGYREHRRVWNGAIDRYPALIARCAGVADVLDALGFARRTGLAVAVRSGGHSFPGQSVYDDGLVIDLSLMKGVRVDPDNRTVRAQAGVRLGELDGRPRPSGWRCRPAS